VVARPYDDPNVPPSYHGQPTPLVVMLHGYSATAYVEEAAIYQLTDVSNDKGFIYATPQGKSDSMQHPFWNATDACCDEDGTGVDDVAYLNAVIDDLQWKYNIDKKRVFITGHSNGGFMSHRMACDSASRLAAIVSLAGMVWLDASKCNPSEPVAVLQVHGDADPTVPYNGSSVEPSAKQTVATWAQKNGCGTTLDATGMTLDLVSNLPGAETRVDAYGGCPANSAAELWTMMGVGHVPAFNHPAWGDEIVDWMFAHPKP
jgi:polyhydroxybutyrate depolymerase